MNSVLVELLQQIGAAQSVAFVAACAVLVFALVAVTFAIRR